MVFSKTYCPYASATKELFEKISVTASVCELDAAKDGEKI
jgi:glutaredoxin